MRVTRANKGFDESFEILKRTGEKPLVWSVDERGRLVWWRPAAAVAVGSFVQTCCARFAPIMLAHMIGVGSCVRRQPVRYASIDGSASAGTKLLTLYRYCQYS